MPIANLANIPDDEDTWNEYSFSLQATIRDINRAILQTRNIALPEFQIDPLNLAQSGVQLAQLQEMVNNINGVLGLSGYDYEDVDLSQPGERASWVWLLFTNLRQATNVLGVG